MEPVRTKKQMVLFAELLLAALVVQAVLMMKVVPAWCALDPRNESKINDLKN